MPKLCVVPLCPIATKKNRTNCSFLSVTKEQSEWKVWENTIPNLKKTLTEGHYVCENYFEEKCLKKKFEYPNINGNITEVRIHYFIRFFLFFTYVFFIN